jgi:hypothetical protein
VFRCESAGGVWASGRRRSAQSDRADAWRGLDLLRAEPRRDLSHDPGRRATSAHPHVRQWLGDARGRWDDRTLVVEITNFTDRTNYYGARETLHLVERFTRVASDMISYQVTIDDPTTFTKPWTIEVPLTKGDEKRNQIFENACHEGNHALTNILAGARAEERAAAPAKGKREGNLTSQVPSRSRR